jgi:hypothetical protein
MGHRRSSRYREGRPPSKLGSEHHNGAEDVKPPGGEVKPWKGHILCPYHDGQEKISENRRQAGNNDQKDHYYAVKGEKAVIGLRAHDIFPGRYQFQSSSAGRVWRQQ